MGMRNKLIDLNNHLFEEIERLNDEDLTDELLQQEIKRANSMAQIAQAIVSNASLAFKAQLQFGNDSPDMFLLEDKK